LWAIWYARRKIIYDYEYQSPLSTHLFIESYLRDLAIAIPSKGTNKGVPAKHPKWIPLDAGCVKVNVDAAMAKTGPGGAVGAVCRDGAGVFMGASTLTVDGITNPTVLDALACREALALALDINASCLTTDCLAIVNDLSRQFAGSYNMVLEEIKETSKLFELVKFKHENRASDGEAHRLARSAASSK
jgi:ribonuclease HI